MAMRFFRRPAPCSQERLHELFEYDAHRGVLLWRERPVSDFDDGKYPAERVAKRWNSKHSGRVAGNITPKGYRCVRVLGKLYMDHRLIWLYVHGDWPDEIGHEHGVEAGNRVENLKDVSHSENMKNIKLRKSSTSDITGVFYFWNKWRARIYANGKTVWLGSFCNKSDAAAARKAAERKYGFHENHGSKRISA